MNIFYPDFVPKTITQQLDTLQNSLEHGPKCFVKTLISMFSRYWAPRILGLSLCPLALALWDKRFLRLNMDHFGPIVYVYSFLNSKNFSHKKTYYVLCHKFPNQDLLRLFPDNIIFLQGTLRQLFFGWMFFLPFRSIHIFPLFEHLYHYRKLCSKSDWAPLTAEPNSLSGLALDSLECPKWLTDATEGKKFILIFNREPGCEYTVGKSLRNIEIDRLCPAIEACQKYGYKMVRYGGEYVSPVADEILNEFDIFDYSKSEYNSSQNDIFLWYYCDAVIGSPSGATHIPSILFSKPTLYVNYPWLSGLAMWHSLHFHSGSIPKNNYWLLPEARAQGVFVEPNERLESENGTNDSVFDCLDYSVLSRHAIKQSVQIFMSEQLSLGSEIANATRTKIKRYHLSSASSLEKRATPFNPGYFPSRRGRILIEKTFD